MLLSSITIAVALDVAAKQRSVKLTHSIRGRAEEYIVIGRVSSELASHVPRADRVCLQIAGPRAHKSPSSREQNIHVWICRQIFTQRSIFLGSGVIVVRNITASRQSTESVFVAAHLPNLYKYNA